MPVTATLDNEQLAADTVVVALEAVEAVSRPFSIDLQFIADTADLDLDALLLTTARVRLADPERAADGDPGRTLHGIVVGADYLFPRGDFHVYRLLLGPRMGVLAHRVRTRIFQDKDAPTIVADVLTDAGIPAEAFSQALTGAYAPRAFCLQWRESELAFVSRLLEDEGIFYFHRHSEEGHELVMADDQQAFAAIEGDTTIALVTRPSAEAPGDWVFDARLMARPVHDSYTARDWNFLAPAKPLEAGAGASELRFERYEWPGGFDEQGTGKRKAARRLAALQAERVVLRGKSNCLRLAPGFTFDLAGAAPSGACRSWLIVETKTRYTSAERAGESAQLSIAFEAIPGDTEFRPPLATPRPCVAGTWSAVVTGPSGEEIHVDQWGRIKVHFSWDREGAVDDTASCWIRVQQQQLQGGMILPRVGWEMRVAFLDGDPDRPIAIDKVYNRETMPPYGLPDNLMQTSLQSASTPGGGGTNEIRMDDSNGAQAFFIHAQKDFQLSVGHDLDEKVGVNASSQVGADEIVKVTLDETVSVGASQSLDVTGAATEQTVGSKSVTVSALEQINVVALASVTTGGARSETVGGLMNVLAEKTTETFNANHTRSVGGAFITASAGPIVEAVAGNKTETIGGAKLEIIKGDKQETAGQAKMLTSASVQEKTGKDFGLSAMGLVIAVGGPMAIKCDGDFAVTGSTVTLVVAGSADIKAGGTSLKMTPASAKLKGGSIGGDAMSIELKGAIKYE